MSEHTDARCALASLTYLGHFSKPGDTPSWRFLQPTFASAPVLLALPADGRARWLTRLQHAPPLA